VLGCCLDFEVDEVGSVRPYVVLLVDVIVEGDALFLEE
jgi:hypothetical protein